MERATIISSKLASSDLSWPFLARMYANTANRNERDLVLERSLTFAQEYVSFPLSVYCIHYTQEQLKDLFIQHMHKAVPYYIDSIAEGFHASVVHAITYRKQEAVERAIEQVVTKGRKRLQTIGGITALGVLIAVLVGVYKKVT